MQMPPTALRDHQPPLGLSRSCPQEPGTRLLLTTLECPPSRLPPQPTHLLNLGNFHKQNWPYREHPDLSLVHFQQIINLFAGVTHVKHLEQCMLSCECFCEGQLASFSYLSACFPLSQVMLSCNIYLLVSRKVESIFWGFFFFPYCFKVISVLCSLQNFYFLCSLVCQWMAKRYQIKVSSYSL